MHTLHINYCERWTVDGPTGRRRCLGTCAPDELAGAVRRAWHDAVRGGWGEGRVVVTDDAGDLHQLSVAS